jgi:DNA-binding XRE family transcriptional regulator
MEKVMPSLKSWRRERLMTQRELAKRAGVATSTVYLIEAGRTLPQIRIMIRLADALDIVPEQISEFRERLGLPAETSPATSRTRTG